MMRSHPEEGDLQALLNGALGWPERIRLGGHLLRCAKCRGRMEEAREREARVGALLAGFSVEADLEEAWQRVQARHRTAAPRHVPPVLSFVGGALAFALVLLIVNGGSFAWPTSIAETSTVLVLQDHCCVDHDGDGLADHGQLVLDDGTRTRVALSYRDLDGSGSLSEGDIIRAVPTGSDP